MKRRLSFTPLVNLLFVLLCLPTMAVAGSKSESGPACGVIKDLYDQYQDKPGIFVSSGIEASYGGLTDEGADRIARIATDLRESDAIVNRKFFAMQHMLDSYRLAQTARWNVMTMGAGGGGKTGMYLFAQPDLWLKQMHELITQMEIMGGQTQAGVEAGKEKRNYEGTIITARNAMVDEGEKANPAILAMLLSLANPNERFVMVGGERIDAHKLRTMIFTGNATIAELLHHFETRGMGTTGPPFLNRFYIKAEAPNWLSQENQMRLDRLVLDTLHAQTMKKSNPKAGESAVLARPKDIEFESLQEFAEGAFTCSDELLHSITKIADAMKLKTNKAMKDSVTERKNGNNTRGSGEDELTLTHAFIPAADYTTRLRMEFVKMIMTSAALDLLRSDMSESDSLKKITRKGKIVLGPDSLWRLSDLLTTVGPNQRIFDPYSQSVHYGVEVKSDKVYLPNESWEDRMAKDAREQTKLIYMRQEQDMFTRTLAQIWQGNAGHFTTGASAKGDKTFDLNNYFEFYMARHATPNVMKVEKKPEVKPMPN